MGHFIKNYKLNYPQTQWSRSPPTQALECCIGMSSKKGHTEVLCLELKLLFFLCVFTRFWTLAAENKSSVALCFIAAHACLSMTKTPWDSFRSCSQKWDVLLIYSMTVFAAIFSNPPEPKVCVCVICNQVCNTSEFITLKAFVVHVFNTITGNCGDLYWGILPIFSHYLLMNHSKEQQSNSVFSLFFQKRKTQLNVCVW